MLQNLISSLSLIDSLETDQWNNKEHRGGREGSLYMNLFLKEEVGS